MSSDKDRIIADPEHFLNMVLIPIRNTDRTKYPMSPGRLKDFYLDLAASDFWAAREALEAQGWSIARMAALFRNPSRVMRMSYYLLEGSHRLGNSADRQHDLLQFLLGLIRHLKVSEPCGGDNVNQQTASTEALAEIHQRGLAAVEPSGARRFHRLAAVLRTYMDAVYLIPHDVGMEMYGPYDSDDQRHFVREFFNLRPVGLWPETEAVPADEVWMAAGYDPGLVVEFDTFNNPYVKAGNYITMCRTTSVLIDGQPATDEQIEALTGALMQVVRAVVAKMTSLPETEQAALYIRCFWLRMRTFLEAAGIDLGPPAAAFERLGKVAALPPPSPPPTLESLRTNLGI